MNQLLEKIALDYLLEQARILFLLVDRHGNIMNTNQYTECLLGSGPCSKRLSSVANGVNAAVLAELARMPGRTRLLNINTASNYAQTVVIRAYQVGEHFLVLGETDAADLEKVTERLFSLNSELNNTARELHKKNVELEQLNLLKTQFLGMAAHDLRTPLNSVMLLCDLLSGEADPSLSVGQARFVNAIAVSAEKMRILIEDFLNSAVIESGKLALDLQPVMISEAIGHVVHSHCSLAASRNITVQVDVPSDCPAAEADPVKLEQVLNNLISNAIEYSPADSQVNVSCTFNSSELTVSVTDCGPGIAPDDRLKLFRPFSTTGAKKGSGQKSTGLGLFISHKIVEAHGGRVWVESKLGSGSTFYVSLPFAKS